MNSIEEIFENGKAEELSIDPFDVEEWAANKKAEAIWMCRADLTSTL